jgi:hypothetical protein
MEIAGYISALREKFSFAHSTDLVGLLTWTGIRSPLETLSFLQKVFDDEFSFGLELVLFRHFEHDKQFLHDLSALRELVAGIHVQAGISQQEHGANLIKLSAANAAMASIDEAYRFIQTLGSGPVYIDTHAPYIERLSVPQILTLADAQKHTPTAFVTVENHVETRSADKVGKQRARAKSWGLPTAETFDLYHALASDPSYNILKEREFSLLWENMLYRLDKAGQCIVHIPVGSDLNDSIPILDLDKIDDEKLVKLAQMLEANHCFPTIEYQRGTKHLLYTNPLADKAEIARSRAVMKRLVAAGIITWRERRFYSLPPVGRATPLSNGTSHAPRAALSA